MYPAYEGALLEAFLKWSGCGARCRVSQTRDREAKGIRPWALIDPPPLCRLDVRWR